MNKERVPHHQHTKGIEHNKRHNTENEAEQEIYRPVSGNSQPIHAHHLDDLSLFFEDDVVEEDGEEQAQR
jgi:hypothetical protein